MELDKLKKLLDGKDIFVFEIIRNKKASEEYVGTTFLQDDGFVWTTYVPFYSRWSAKYYTKEEDVAAYLEELRPYFTWQRMEAWKRKEWNKWKNNKGNVTKYIFKALLSFMPEHEFPLSDGSFSDNPAKRIQDIKNAGYTVASIPNSENKQKTDRILLPIPLNNELGYETYTKQFKSRVIRLLKGINAYEAKPTSKSGLIPDHKFSEVRWNSETKDINSMQMTDEEIIHKFQLLDNQRNQQKREVCRQCFQEGVRGSIYGIKYFYKGGEKWDANIPTSGKEAEKGCEGCPWYDIEEWRRMLNEQLKKGK